MRGRLLLVLGDVVEGRAGDVVFQLEGVDKRRALESIVEDWNAARVAGRAPARTVVFVDDGADYYDLLDSVFGASEHWREGIACLARQEYWQAHEEWEDVWKFLGGSALRDALQGLIQFAAACYKPQQVVMALESGAAGKQRGMGALVASAARYFRNAELLMEGTGPRPGFGFGAVQRGLAMLEDVQAGWVSGGLLLDEVQEQVEVIAGMVVESLAGEGVELFRG